MSSIRSSAPADGPGVLAALTDVAEQSFYAFVEPCDADPSREDLPPGTDWISCAMRFTSESQEGEVAVVLPVSLACELAAAFAGCDTGQLDAPLVQDAVGELCNMVGGLWLTRASTTRDSFRLQPPRVSPSIAPAAAQGWTLVRVNGTPMGLRARRRAVS
jgi:hypothetical protein